jgi:hypothetical protein
LSFSSRACSSIARGAPFAVVSNTARVDESTPRHLEERSEMLFTLALILFVAWLLGLVGVYTIGSIVHLLLVVAIVLFLVGIISGRRTVV